MQARLLRIETNPITFAAELFIPLPESLNTFLSIWMRLCNFELPIEVLLQKTGPILLHISCPPQAIVDILLEQVVHVNTIHKCLSLSSLCLTSCLPRQLWLLYLIGIHEALLWSPNDRIVDLIVINGPF